MTFFDTVLDGLGALTRATIGPFLALPLWALVVGLLATVGLVALVASPVVAAVAVVADGVLALVLIATGRLG